MNTQHVTLRLARMGRNLAGALLAAVGLQLAAHPAVAQEVPVAVDHTALYVFDLKKSEAFYRDVMHLPEIPEPFKDGRHIWFRTGPHSQLHIIQGAAKVEPHDINTHLAFRVKDLPAFLARLDQAQVKYGAWKGDSKQPTLRPDGVKQVYLQDPDNFWLEVNDDPF